MGWDRERETAKVSSLNSPLPPLSLSSDGDDRMIFGGLKCSIPGFFG